MPRSVILGLTQNPVIKHQPVFQIHLEVIMYPLPEHLQRPETKKAELTESFARTCYFQIKEKWKITSWSKAEGVPQRRSV
jgi:hypothetical protein